MKGRKNHQYWTWIIMIAFILLSILDMRFGLFGFVCIGTPLYHALRGRGKLHCAKHCPRGSLLGKFLQRISLRQSLPSSWRSNTVKNVLVGLMLVMFALSVAHALQQPNVTKALAFATFRLMMSSLTFGILMGVYFTPRSWCQVCPIGHGTELISRLQSSTNERNFPREKKQPAA